jgi:hypothetical protein
MASTIIPPGNFATLNLAGLDINGTSEAVHGTAVVSDYTQAYCQANYAGVPLQFAIVPKVTPPAGAVSNITVTFSSTAADGSVLPAFVEAYTLQGPPLPPPATHLAQLGNVVSGFAGKPATVDPGSGTVSF